MDYFLGILFGGVLTAALLLLFSAVDPRMRREARVRVRAIGAGLVGAAGLLLSINAAAQVAAASQPVAPDIDVAQVLLQVVNAFQAGKWISGVSLVLMVVTWVFSMVAARYRPGWLNPSWVPWIAAVLGVLTTTFAAAAAGAAWSSAVVGGLVTGAAASGLWSLVGKHLLTGRDEKLRKERARTLAAPYRDDLGAAESRVAAARRELLEAERHLVNLEVKK